MSSKKSAGKKSFDVGQFTDALEEAVAAERAGRDAGAVSDVVRKSFPAARDASFESGPRGDKIALRFSNSVDAIMRQLCGHAPQGETDLALCAVGGYGRRELAPYSDIDLLFIHGSGDDAAIRPIIDFMLYPLWDAGVKVGHGVHTPKSAVAFAKEDMVARTAYLDIRFLCGSKDLFDEFAEGYDRLRKRTGAQFVAAKLKEQDERQKAAGETRYVVEPDIKEGKGGLRDIQTIRWIYKYIYEGVADGAKADIEKILGPNNVRDLAKAERFLWSVRACLHALRGRADEKLTFDIQPAVADRLNYQDRRDMTAAERLMRHYFVTAVDTGKLTRILCTRLEEESAKRLPHLPKFLPKAMQTDEAAGKPNIRIHNGRLDFASPARAAKTPRDFFRLFRAFSKNPKIDFHPDALGLIADNVASVTTPVRKDPAIAALFKGILQSNDDPVRALRVMTETGLLSKYIPAWGNIVGRIDYGLYRRFTLDEEVLRAIGVLRDIRAGQLADEHPVSTKVVRGATDSFYISLALLLHESIWTVTDQRPDECEKLVRRIVKRLGLSNDEAGLAAWGAANHLTLIRTAEQRNLTDAHAIATFAEEVGTQERLDLMVVLTTCHLKIVGHDSWDEATRRQLIELYESASAWMADGEEGLQKRLDARAEMARKEARTRLSDWSSAEKDAFLSRLNDDMLHCLNSDMVVRFAYLARAADKDKADAAVTVTPRDGDLECFVYADDRPGLLADIAGAIANAGLSLRYVHALTTEDGRAFDIFVVHSADGMPADDPDVARRLHGAMLAAARAAPKPPAAFKRRFGDRRSIFSIVPAVRVELDASRDAAVVEAEGLDRPGLLYEMASALGDLGAAIASAHIATYGERAVDVFYLTDAKGKKIRDGKVLKQIKLRLLEVLASGAGA